MKFGAIAACLVAVQGCGDTGSERAVRNPRPGGGTGATAGIPDDPSGGTSATSAGSGGSGAGVSSGGNTNTGGTKSIPPGPVTCNGPSEIDDAEITGSQVKGPAKSRPFLKVSGANKASSDTLIASYTEADWVKLVPRSSARENGPQCPNGGSFTWDPKDPDRIRCGSTTYDPKTPDQFVKAEVLGGKTIDLPAWKMPDGSLTYLQGKIDEQKWVFWDNRLPQLGATYQQTKDEKYARRVALLLDTWATNLANSYLSKDNDDAPITVAEATKLNFWILRASPRNNMSREVHEGLVEAFDRIYDSKALADLSKERGYDVREHIIKDYLFNTADYLTKTVPIETHTKTNLSEPYARLGQIATITGRSDYIEWLNEYFKMSMENLKRDGMFPESFGYHQQYIESNTTGTRNMAQFFEVWTPDNDAATKLQNKALFYENILAEGFEASYAAALPDGNEAPFGDTHLQKVRDPRTATSSHLLPAYGHAVLGAGSAGEQTQLNFGFNDNANHCHWDVLGFTVYAFERELNGELRYSRINGRAFTEATLAHNTVTIDRKNQYRSNNQGGGNVGHLFTGGNLLQYLPNVAGISVAEVDGARAYLGTAERYQRTLILNARDTKHPYVVDLFSVKGGSTHDYFLHGAALFDETATSAVPLTKIDKTYPLLPDGQTWKSTDPSDDFPNLDWYGAFRNMSTARSSGAWNVTFSESGGTRGTRIFGIDAANVDLFLGQSPSPYRSKTEIGFYDHFRPSLLVRHQGAAGLETLFVSVIEPFVGSSEISSVERLALSVSDAAHVGLKITFKSGRVDVLLADLTNQSPSAKGSEARFQTQDGKYALTGRFGLASTTSGTTQNYLITGTRFESAGATLESEQAVLAGSISEVARQVEDCSHNAFVTSAALPAGEVLKGQWLRLAFDKYAVVPDANNRYPLNIREQNNTTELYEIERVEQQGDKNFIVLRDDPELHIENGTATETTRPHRTFSGSVSFEIVNAVTK